MESEIARLQDGESVVNNGLAIKIFSETCCNGCTCSSSNDHKQESRCFCGDEVCSC